MVSLSQFTSQLEHEKLVFHIAWFLCTIPVVIMAGYGMEGRGSFHGKDRNLPLCYHVLVDSGVHPASIQIVSLSLSVW
jgi:hypothetical protein